MIGAVRFHQTRYRTYDSTAPGDEVLSPIARYFVERLVGAGTEPVLVAPAPSTIDAVPVLAAYGIPVNYLPDVQLSGVLPGRMGGGYIRGKRLADILRDPREIAAR